MKYSLFAVFASILFNLVSCDIVDEPFIENGGNSDDNNVQKVLLEEFTGHQCPNCPGGAAIAKQINDFYGEKVIIIAYHAGFFARTSTSFPADYRTTEGDELNTYYDIEYNPVGMVNRKSINNSVLINPVDWGTVVSGQVDNLPDFSITSSSNFNPSNRFLSVGVKITALHAVSYSAKVCAYLTEDSLISRQSVSGDSNYPDGYIPDYVHMHVFRTSLNGTWGEGIFESGAGNNQSESLSYSITLPENWKADNCNLVVFVYFGVTGEVIQVDSRRIN